MPRTLSFSFFSYLFLQLFVLGIFFLLLPLLYGLWSWRVNNTPPVVYDSDKGLDRGEEDMGITAGVSGLPGCLRRLIPHYTISVSLVFLFLQIDYTSIKLKVCRLYRFSGGFLCTKLFFASSQWIRGLFVLDMPLATSLVVCCLLCAKSFLLHNGTLPLCKRSFFFLHITGKEQTKRQISGQTKRKGKQYAREKKIIRGKQDCVKKREKQKKNDTAEIDLKSPMESETDQEGVVDLKLDRKQ